MRRLLVLGASGFVGIHLLPLLRRYQSPNFQVIPWSRRDDGSLLHADSIKKVFDKFQPSEIVQLAWGNLGPKADLHTQEHYQWLNFSYGLTELVSETDTKVWFFGTGIELDEETITATAYGSSKIELKKHILSLGNPMLKWITLPYIFSISHEQPRLLRDRLNTGEEFSPRNPNSTHSYLEIRDCSTRISEYVVHDHEESALFVIDGKTASNTDFIKCLDTATRIRELAECKSCSTGLIDLQSFNYYTKLFFNNTDDLYRK
jgi:hypothetical protein